MNKDGFKYNMGKLNASRLPKQLVGKCITHYNTHYTDSYLTTNLSSLDICHVCQPQGETASLRMSFLSKLPAG